MKLKIIATLGLSAIVVGTAMLFRGLADPARFNGTSALLYCVMPMVLFVLTRLVMASRKRR